MSKVDFRSSIYKKIINIKASSGSQEDVMRRLLQNGSTSGTLREIFSSYSYEDIEEIAIKNGRDIKETHRIIQEYISKQAETYDFFEIDVIDDILCPTFELTREEIEFLANTEPY